MNTAFVNLKIKNCLICRRAQNFKNRDKKNIKTVSYVIVMVFIMVSRW